MFLVSHGGAIHAVNGRSQLLSEGSFVLMRPRDVHRYDFFNNADFELLDIGIPRTVFERLCDYLQLDRAIFDTPELPLHCVLSGYTLTDVQEKLLNTNRFADNETACRYIGMTSTEHINGKRLSLAAQLLLQGDMPVIEICGACGFNSLSRFLPLIYGALRLCTEGVPHAVCACAVRTRFAYISIIIVLPFDFLKRID